VDLKWRDIITGRDSLTLCTLGIRIAAGHTLALTEGAVFQLQNFVRTNPVRKSFIAILLLLLGTSLAFSVQQPANWITYTSPEGRYSVSLPTEPKVTTQESTTADGEKFPQYLATAGGADGTFMIGYFEIASGSEFSAIGARDSMVKIIGGRLMGDNAISLGGYPGHDFKIALKLPLAPASGEVPPQTDYVDRARIYEVGKRVYILQAIFPKSLETDANINVTRFFDSFQLVKN
jgi:hypothetical protein